MSLVLPSDWGTYDAAKKINWFNQNQVDTNTLLSQGVDQASINWMLNNGYVGAYAPPPPPPPPPAPYVAPTPAPAPEVYEPYYSYEPNYSYEDLITDVYTPPSPSPAPTPAPAPAQQFVFGDVTLPSDWYTRTAEQKIRYFNEQDLTPEELLGAGAGITEADIDFWRKNMGYTAGLPAPTPAPTPAPAPAPTDTLPDFSNIINPFTGEPFGSIDVAAATRQIEEEEDAAKERAVSDLTTQIASQWQQFGINPDIQGVNRANELAQILFNYGITDLSKLGIKESTYDELVNLGYGGENAVDDWQTVTKTRGQLTYGDQTFGRLGGFGSGGEKEFAAPQEYLQQADPGSYGLGYSAAGKGWVEYELVPGPGGKPVIVPRWGSTSDITPELLQVLAFAAAPFTGGLSATLAPVVGAAAAPILSQALISGGLGGLGAVAQGESFGEGFGKGALTGGLTAGIGSLVTPAANAVASSVLNATDSQLLADIASGAIKGGASALPSALMSGNFSNVLTGALSGGVGSGVGNVLGSVLPDEITGNINVDNALIKGAQGLASAATRAAITGQDINVTGALLPAVAQGIADEYKLPLNQVTAGLQVASKLLQGGDLSPADILRLGTSLASSPTKPTAGQAASAGYGGADAGDFFDSEEAQAVEDDIASILARYPEAEPAPTPAPAPYFPEFEEPLLTAEPPAEQRYEVVAPAPAPYFPEFEEPFPVYTPEPAQQVEIKQALPTPEIPAPEVPPVEEPRYVDVTEGQPQQVEITGGGESLGNLLADLGLVTQLPETPFIPPEDIPAVVAPPVEAPTVPKPVPDQQYEVTAPAPQNVFDLPADILDLIRGEPEPVAPIPPPAIAEPPGVVEGPSTIETTGTKLPETPIIPLEDVPEVVYPEILPPPVPPAPTPAPTPRPPSPAPAPAPAALTPAPAPKRQDDLALLMLLAAMMTPQQEEEEKYQLAQILGVESPFGRIV